MNNDKISDMITRIRNGYLAGKEVVTMPHTKVLENIAKVLVEEKYLASTSVEEVEAKKTLRVELLYSGHTPAISTIKRISKPGVRIYTNVHSIKPVLSGLGIAVISTSRGIMTDRTARKTKVGGEVLFELW